VFVLQRTVSYLPPLAVLLMLMTPPALSQTDPLGAPMDKAAKTTNPALFPAAQCAALWFGQDDYAQVSPYLDRDPKDLQLAEAFRAVALRLTTQSPAAIDAFIAAQRRQMSLLVEAFIFGSDRSSRRLYESLMQDCSDFAARQPETRDLR
jgi:hypothetical protein